MKKWKWNLFEWSVFMLIIGLLIFLMIGGCTTKIVWTDDVFAVSSSWVSWGETDDLILDVNDTMLSAGSSKYHSDANAAGKIAEGIIEGILP